MINALVQGKLIKAPIQRMGKVPFVTAKVRAPTDGTEAVFIDVIVFDEAACRSLLALSDGDPVALAGTLTPRVWVNAKGIPVAALNMVAQEVLTLAAAQRKRTGTPPPTRNRSQS